MYSQCPECQTRFRVTAAALRAAHGTVRCGRCGNAFDALERLSDSIPPVADVAPPVPLELPGAPLAAPAPAPTVAAEPELPLSSDALERVFIGSADWHGQFEAGAAELAGETGPAGDDGEPTFLVVDEDASVEDITLEGDRHEEHVALDASGLAEAMTDEPEPAALAEADPSWAQDASLEFAHVRASAPADVAPEGVEEPLRTEPAWREIEETAQRSGTSFWRVAAWAAGSLVLALALAAQVIHRYRQDLVRHPQLGPPLRATYDRLGLPLAPNWDLAAFELRQWGSDAGAASEGRMVVRASLKNGAAFAQPHPILRLELEDRFGATVATRDFEPADYLKNPSQASRLIAPGATSEAELLLVDPGPDAVGYRLDLCLRESASLLRCAQGPG
jgi:predicted Zn finger-like uncharacterized protein